MDIYSNKNVEIINNEWYILESIQSNGIQFTWIVSIVILLLQKDDYESNSRNHLSVITLLIGIV